MVYRGPSTGCGTCRRRRVKCDGRKPHCWNCQKRARLCTGYDGLFDRVHRDQNAAIRRKLKVSELLGRVEANLLLFSRQTHTETDEDTLEYPWMNPFGLSLTNESDESLFDRRVIAVISAVPQHIDKSFEDESTDMFLTIYCGVHASKRVAGGFMHHLYPKLMKTSLNSPLHKAVAAVAVNMAILWSFDPKASHIHRQYYIQAVNSLRKALSCPDRSRDDDVLMAALLLDFCDALNAQVRGDKESWQRTHQTGALALVKHRGTSNFKNETSKAMLAHLQCGVIHNALQKQSSLPPGSRMLFEQPEMNQGMAMGLDMLAVPLTEILSRARTALRDLSNATSGNNVAHLCDELLGLDRRYTSWHSKLPEDCQPRLVWGNKIPEQIRRAGVYRNQCSVYTDLQIAHMQNLWRMRRVMLLHMLKDCTLALQAHEDVPERFIASEIDQIIQNLVDGVCDSVPFFLGDYLDKVPPLRHSPLTFPRHEDEQGSYPQDLKHHVWHATCAGAWLVVTPLINLSGFTCSRAYTRPFVLRSGQAEWIRAQLNRLELAWKLPADSWPKSPVHLEELEHKKRLVWVSMAHRV